MSKYMSSGDIVCPKCGSHFKKILKGVYDDNGIVICEDCFKEMYDEEECCDTCDDNELYYAGYVDDEL